MLPCLCNANLKLVLMLRNCMVLLLRIISCIVLVYMRRTMIVSSLHAISATNTALERAGAARYIFHIFIPVLLKQHFLILTTGKYMDFSS